MAKHRPIRLTGKKLRTLNNAIHVRDGHHCVICQAYVPDDTKFHHEPIGANKEDRMECGVVLCDRCHFERHNGLGGLKVKFKVEEYLDGIYGGCQNV
jgi:hypothetical protein